MTQRAGTIDLRKLRVSRLWTQAKAGELAGVDPAEISRAELGKPVSKFSKVKIARLYELDVDDIFPEPDEASS